MLNLVSEEKNLSCFSKESATENSTQFNPQLTVLSKYDFTIPGMGHAPAYCEKPYVNGIADDGSGAHVMFTRCKKMSCPDCYDLWRLQQVFKYTVMLEAYAKHSGMRPCRGSYSINPKQEFTLDDIRKFIRNGKDRLRYQGMDAGVTWFHFLRVDPFKKRVIRKIIGNHGSAGDWNFIRNEDNIEVFNKHCSTKVKTWYDYVCVGPHAHFIAFPGDAIVTGDSKGKIVIKKDHWKKDGVDIWELKGTEDVFRFVMYLSSHVTQLNNGSKSRFKPFKPFGALDKVNLLDLVTPDELREIQANVLELINRMRTQKFDIKDGDLVYATDDQKDKVNFIPLSDFRYSSLIGQINAKNLIEYVTRNCPENAAYLAYLIKLYNYVLASKDVPFKFRRLFLTAFECTSEGMPEFVKDMDDRNPVKQMFINGLRDPPDTFTFYFNNYLKDKEQQYKDRFKPATKFSADNSLDKPDIVSLCTEQRIKDERFVKPDIKIDDAFIAAIEKKFLKLNSESIKHAVA
ncbi:MAG: hypothetical protein P4M12_10580 [Gammaproteobacteria bacterium]|nr:hypothetical protein [Gammaproteobacteria bacterium]